jgi:hypothetical protein
MRLQCQPKTKPAAMAAASNQRRSTKADTSDTRETITEATTANTVLHNIQQRALRRSDLRCSSKHYICVKTWCSVRLHR